MTAYRCRPGGIRRTARRQTEESAKRVGARRIAHLVNSVLDAVLVVAGLAWQIAVVMVAGAKYRLRRPRWIDRATGQRLSTSLCGRRHARCGGACYQHEPASEERKPV